MGLKARHQYPFVVVSRYLDDFIPGRQITKNTGSLWDAKDVWGQNLIGPRVNHSEACRARIEKAILEDATDDRAVKANERIDHDLAQKVEAGDAW